MSFLYILKEWQGELQCLTEIWQQYFSLNFSAENQGNPDINMCVYVSISK